MNFISQMFSKINFKLFFIVGSTSLFFILPEYLNISWWCFSSSFSTCEDRRRFFFQSCSILFKIRHSSLLPSSHNCFRLSEFFSPIRSKFSSIFSLIIRSPSSQIYSFLAFSYHSPNITGASLKYPLISSWSIRSLVSKFLQVSSVVFQFFPVSCAFATFSSNSYGGSFKILLYTLLYQFTHSFQFYRWLVEDLLKVALYLS